MRQKKVETEKEKEKRERRNNRARERRREKAEKVNRPPKSYDGWNDPCNNPGPYNRGNYSDD